jgi:DNA-binding CsgD family transcriptional regulator
MMMAHSTLTGEQSRAARPAEQSIGDPYRNCGGSGAGAARRGAVAFPLRRGESRLTPQIARKVMDQFRRLAVSPRVDAPIEADAEPLSDKEEKILQLICEGMMNRQIANALSLAEGTVKNYLSRIMEKLHANTRTELAVLSSRSSLARMEMEGPACPSSK